MRGVAAATVFSAISGYVVLFLAARALGAARYEVFAVFWAVFFALAGIVNGLMNETTRAVHNASGYLASTEDAAGRRRARPVRLAFGVGIAFAAVVAATAPLWAERVLPRTAGPGTALLAAAIASFAIQAALGGALSGSGRWPSFAWLLVLDAGLRLVVALGVVAFGWGEVGFMAATVAGAAGWLILMSSGTARAARHERADVPTAAFLGRVLRAMLATSATAVLVVGFPALLKAVAPDEDPRLLGAVLLAVTLTRAPVLVPLSTFQTAIVVHFVEQRRRGARALLLPSLATVAVAAVGAGAAWLVGPPVLALMGEGFELSGAVLAALTLASAATAMLFLSGAAALAHERHTHYLLGWWAATLSVAAGLASAAPLTTRTVLALGLGPLVGVAWHVLAIALNRQEATPDV